MRPDIEDFEELNVPADDAPRSRAMSWLVLAVAVGGFGALAYYAYHSGTQNMQNGDVLVVQADETPIKEAPANPEGEQFANQDKTIYDVIAPNASEDKVEKLLPEPEKPVAVPQEAPAPTTYVNKNLTPSVPAVAASDPAKKTDAAKPAPLVVPVPSSAPKKTETAVVTPVKTAPANIEEEAIEGEPNFVNESPVVTEAKPVATEKPAAKKEPVKTEPKKEVAAAKPAAAAKSGGAYQVQLGAFKSEDEANAAWKKLSAKYSGVLGGSQSIVKADLPNGTFYRLRAGSFASGDAAKAACAKLNGAACYPVAK